MASDDDEYLDPRVIAVLPLLEDGLAHHAAGRLDQAATLYEQALAQVPDLSDALHLLGQIALSRGDNERAIDLIRQAIGHLPEPAPEMHLTLGTAYAAADRLEQSATSYREAIAIEPSLAMAHANLARVLNLLGQFEAALASSEAALARDDRLRDGYLNQIAALRGLGRLAQIEAPLRQAMALQPDDPAVIRELANLLADFQRHREAVELHRQAIALGPYDAASHFAMASTLLRMNDAEGARSYAGRALELTPDVAVYWIMLGTAERALGRFLEAEDALRRALELDPTSAMARYQLGFTKGQHDEGTEERALRAALGRDDSGDMDRVLAGFALGKLLDNADRFDEAFPVIDKASTAYLRIQAQAGEHHDHSAFSRAVDRIIAETPRTLFPTLQGLGTATELPVFIVGMPRSGTSLVEQIAASHSQVFGAGEQTDHLAMAYELGRRHGGRPRADWPAEAVRMLAAASLERLRQFGGSAARVINKLPDNILALDHAAALYPGARVLYVKREARDCCLSNYFQMFTRGSLWSYDLSDCGRRMRDIERLGRHWVEVLPIRVLEIQYETLVGDLEGESRRLIEFLGLEWEPDCLDFHKTQRSVTTASSWQVRQPLYNSSVGRWRHYRHHLGPLFMALGLHGSQD